MPDVLPHDDAAERATLGAILLEPKRALDAVALGPLSFYSQKHRVIFRGIADSLKRFKTVDLVLLAQVLQNGKMDEAGGPAYLLGLLDGVSRSTNLLHYVGILIDLEARRAAILGAARIAEQARKENVASVSASIRAFAAEIEASLPKTVAHRLDVREVMTGVLPPIPWIVEGWIGQGDWATLGGEWGTGKSVVALDLALAVATGLPFLGKLRVAKETPVIYVDEENNPINAARRFRRMALGRGLTATSEIPVVYLTRNRVRLDTERGRGMLSQEIKSVGAGLVVLDSLVKFARLKSNDNDELARFHDECVGPLIHEYGCTILALDHMRKPTKDDKDIDPGHRIAGGQYKAGAADTVLTLQGKRDEPTRLLSCSKNRWEDSTPPPITTSWMVSEDESSAWIKADDGQLSCEIAVHAELSDWRMEGIYATDLFAALEGRGVSRRTAIRTVKRMAIEGTISRFEEPGNRVKYRPQGCQ